MANPFYIPVQNQVTPALGNLTQAVTGAGQMIEQRRQYEQEELKKAEAKQEIEEAITGLDKAYQEKDWGAIARYSAKYPKISESIMNTMNFKNEETKRNMLDTGFNILNNPDPENIERQLGDRVELVRALGGNPEDTEIFIEFAKQNPEQFLEDVHGYMAATGGQRYTDYLSSLEKRKKTEKVEYSNVKQGSDGRYIGINSLTGRYEEIPGDYSAPAKTKKLKEVKGGVKYYEDGSEEPIGAGEQVANPVTGRKMNMEQADATLAEAKEFQLKNGGFAITLDSGIQTLDKMYNEGYNPSNAAWVQEVFGEGTLPSRTLMSDEDQVFFGAVDQMINAIARRETGAAITEFERKDFFNRYMPKAADKPKRIKQKQEALRRQLRSIAGQSGGVYEALKVTGQDENLPEGDPRKTPPANNVVLTHPQFGDVTEADIQETMQANNLTREQVMARLGGQ